MRNVRELTTEEIRANYLPPRTEPDDADTEFNLWLVKERNRVAQLAMEKERKRIIKLIEESNG
jgi:hypothetical protein